MEPSTDERIRLSILILLSMFLLAMITLLLIAAISAIGFIRVALIVGGIITLSGVVFRLTGSKLLNDWLDSKM